MHVIFARNVNDALQQGLLYMQREGYLEGSRNGDVIVAPGPVVTVYEKPWERVLFSPMRDANPFFHLMESLWMLHGDNDVAFPAYFNKGMQKYSDDSVTLWGAYGFRWREFFGYDQLNRVIDELRNNSGSRRAVVAMWNSWGPDDSGMEFHDDLSVAMDGGQDVPCNTHAYFDCRGGRLNMTVCNRSNDVIWGAYGANAVHLSFLQEYIATAVDVPMGEYRQFSNNYHIYTEKLPTEQWENMVVDTRRHNLYDDQPRKHVHLIDGDEEYQGFDAELTTFMGEARALIKSGAVLPYKLSFANKFLRTVAWPMFMAWHNRRIDNGTGLEWVDDIAADDWRVVCYAWIARRQPKQEL